MDTKTFYDLALDEGFNWDKANFEYWDMVEPCVDHYMHTPELLFDMWIDGLVDAQNDEERWKVIAREFSQVHGSVGDIQKHGHVDGGLALSYAAGASMRAAHLGQSMWKAVTKLIRSYVEKNVQEWCDDAYAYHCDMREGQREDYLYEQAKDRKLEERLERGE